MAPQTGTYDISTLLRARFPFTNSGSFSFAEVTRVLQADIAAHNAVVTSMLADLCEVTTDRQRVYGSSSAGEMIEVDEYGRAPTQVALPGATVAFPLRKFQYALGWTNTFLKAAQVADIAKMTQEAEAAHLRAVVTALKQAIFRAANYTFSDFLVDKVSLAVKRFVNADSAPIPNGPNGEVFVPASHTHYLAAAGAFATAAELKTQVDHVIEHGHGGMVKLNINRANEAAVRLLSGFTPYVEANLRIPDSTSIATGVNLDTSRLDNRAIGKFEGAEVWVKSWVPANYSFAYDSASPLKPLAYRQRETASLQGLRIAAEFDTFPLQAQYMEAEYGVGALERTNGSVMFLTANGGAYTDAL
jgi:hypothetical protein